MVVVVLGVEIEDEEVDEPPACADIPEDVCAELLPAEVVVELVDTLEEDMDDDEDDEETDDEEVDDAVLLGAAVVVVVVVTVVSAGVVVACV